jgi:CheY-like chemotaxis protein/DNA-binding PadR family transcriptional regulator
MSVPHTLLRLLMEGPTHGYELRRKLATYRHFYPLNNVNVYPVLKDLEEQGLVCSRSELSESRIRKIYEITAKGVGEFEQWIDVPPEAALPVETDLIALKLALAPNRSGSGVAWLSRCLAELDEEIVLWRAYIEMGRGTIPRLALLTAEYRLRSYEHRREYLAEATRITLAGENEDALHRAPRILVADDSSASRALTKHLLSAAGYDVRVAEDGAEAWDLLQQSVFDVLVSDAVMPEIDGFELLRRVRASAELSDLPVILNTVLGEADEREAALAAGANDYVYKNNADSGRRLVDVVDRVTGTGSGSGHS